MGAVATRPFQRIPSGLLVDGKEARRGQSMIGHQLYEKDTCKNTFPLSQSH